MKNEEFEQIIRQTLDKLPEEFKSQLDNVEITIEDSYMGDENGGRPGALLGLYHGVPKNQRFSYSSLPDKITIYKDTILSIAHNEQAAREIITDTVLHELGHHFGLSDDDLDKIKKT